MASKKRQQKEKIKKLKESIKRKLIVPPYLCATAGVVYRLRERTAGALHTGAVLYTGFALYTGTALFKLCMLTR